MSRQPALAFVSVVIVLSVAWAALPAVALSYGPLDAEFSNVQGTSTVQKVTVTAEQEVQRVKIRWDGGDWNPMTKRTGGVWRSAYTLPTDAIVEFKASAPETSPTISHQGWKWTSEGPQLVPSGGALVEWAEPTGDRDLIQVNTFSSQPISLHEMRVQNRTDWVSMAIDPRGDYVASVWEFGQLDGVVIQFRATLEDGTRVKSDPIAWPPYSATGTFAKYRFTNSIRSIETTDYTLWEGTVKFTRGVDGWTGVCKATVTESTDGVVSTRQETVDVGGSMRGEPNPVIGETEFVPMMFLCGYIPVETTVTDQRDYTTELAAPDGGPLVRRAWHGTYTFGDARESHMYWDAAEGLVLQWDLFARDDAKYRTSGALVATDIFDTA